MKVNGLTAFILLAVLSLSAYGQFRTFTPVDATGRANAVVLKGRVDGATFGLSWETRVEPPAPAPEAGFETRTVSEPDVVHRILFDRVRHTWFGYDLRVEQPRESGAYRITWSPLSTTPERMARLLPDRSSEWTSLASPRFPEPLTVRADDTVLLEVLVNPATGQKIVDYVTVTDSRGGTTP